MATQPLIGPVLIGEAPPGFPTQRHSPLYPNPVGCTGHRLLRLTGFSLHEYLRIFTRVNLLPAAPLRWNRESKAAAASCAALMRPYLKGNRALLLGVQVRDAFCLTEQEPLSWKETDGHELAWMPHPSGRNAWYSQPRNRRSVERFFADWRSIILTPSGSH